MFTTYIYVETPLQNKMLHVQYFNKSEYIGDTEDDKKHGFLNLPMVFPQPLF